MKPRAFIPKPQEKSEDYHGGCQIAWLPDAYRNGGHSGIPKSINFDLTFEEALKFNIAIQSCLQALNRYNRSKKAGKKMSVGLCIKFPERQLTVMESRVER